MTLLDAFILGVVQALTEFLPVSSSGHLVLAQKLFGMNTQCDATFEVILHLGTLLSVCFYFRKQIFDLVLGFGLEASDERQAWQMKMRFLILGTLPAGIIGILFKDQIESLFGNPKIVAVCLIITGLIVFSTTLKKETQTQQSITLINDHQIAPMHLQPWSGLWVGLAQAFAILPGISRSGSTIAMALLLKIPRKPAAELSFMLSIPVVGGAGLLKVLDLMKDETPIQWLPVFIGFSTSLILGYLVLKMMLTWLEKPSFSWLGIYCMIAGALALLFLS
jgi:undecaprenyl-diphosphatase